MPRSQIWQFTCPISGMSADSADGNPPARWQWIGQEAYSPVGLYIIAVRLHASPLIPIEQAFAPGSDAEIADAIQVITDAENAEGS